MKMSKQDKYYLDVEADAFFERNRYDFSVLPEKKMRFMEYFITFLAKENISNILEIGCHIGDLLNYTVAAVGASAGCGIDQEVAGHDRETESMEPAAEPEAAVGVGADGNMESAQQRSSIHL